MSNIDDLIAGGGLRPMQAPQQAASPWNFLPPGYGGYGGGGYGGGYPLSWAGALTGMPQGGYGGGQPGRHPFSWIGALTGIPQYRGYGGGNGGPNGIGSMDLNPSRGDQPPDIGGYNPPSLPDSFWQLPIVPDLQQGGGGKGYPLLGTLI